MKKRLILLASISMLLAACGGTNNPQKSVSDSATSTPSYDIDGAIALKANFQGEEVSILHEGPQGYIDAMYAAAEEEGLSDDEIYMMRKNSCPGVKVTDYQGTTDGNDRDDFQPIKLAWEMEGYEGKYKVKYGTSEDLSDAKIIETSESETSLVNLFVDTTYYWQVETEDGKHDSEVGSFHTKGHYRMIKSGLAYNVRDFGGKMTRSGRRIKQGLIYRGGELTDVWFDSGSKQKHIVTLDLETKDIFLNTMNIRTDLDFRNAGGESNNISDSPLNKKLEGEGDEFSGIKVTFNRQSVGSLTGFWGGNAKMLKSIYTTFMNAKEDAAVYCHCWGGADRTGTAFFLLEGLLGVSYTECLIDYELTSFDTIHTRRRDTIVTDENGYSYNFPSLPEQIMKDYDATTMSFSEICENWMKDRVGFTDDEIEQLRENLLEEEI